MEIINLFRILLYVGPIQSYFHLKMGLTPVQKAGSSGILTFNANNYREGGIFYFLNSGRKL
jgi:hypothetical protein